MPREIVGASTVPPKFPSSEHSAWAWAREKLQKWINFYCQAVKSKLLGTESTQQITEEREGEKVRWVVFSFQTKEFCCGPRTVCPLLRGRIVSFLQLYVWQILDFMLSTTPSVASFLFCFNSKSIWNLTKPQLARYVTWSQGPTSHLDASLFLMSEPSSHYTTSAIRFHKDRIHSWVWVQTSYFGECLKIPCHLILAWRINIICVFLRLPRDCF